MSRLGSFTRYWLPVALWMSLLLPASTDAFDVLWDSPGAAAGLAGLWGWGRWKQCG